VKQQQILVAQLQTMYPQVKFLFMGIMALTVVILNVFWDKIPLITLISWAGANLILIILRSFFLIYSENNLNLNNVRIHALIFALGSLSSGFIWASASYIFLDVDNNISLIIIVTLLLGSTAGALVTLSAYLPAFYAYSCTVLIPLAWLLITQGSPEIIQIGILVGIYLVALIGYSHAVNKNLKQFIALRFKNETLLQDFRVQRDLAEQANIEKSRYLAATSHDLRQPLHALQLYLGNLSTLNNSEQQQQLIKKSVAAGSTLNNLLTSLMDVSRLDSGELELNMRSVNLELLIADIAEEFQAIAERSGIQLTVCALPVNAFTDAMLLSRCIRNLLANAFAHASASAISIATTIHHEKQLKISIKDNGTGIKHSEKVNIFSEFYQLNNPERDKNKGLGLGLAIVKKLAVLMGHTIELETAEGAGCEFSIYLNASNLLPTKKLKSEPNIDLSGIFVVIVDDNPEICEGMALTFKNWNCEVLVAQNTQTLLGELQRLNYPAPDIIIADYRLRDNKTGVETIKRAREKFGFEIPAILVSGDTGETLIRESAGVNCHYLQKPVPPAHFKQVISSMIKKRTS